MYNSAKGLKSDKIPADPNDVVRKTELDTETAEREAWDANHEALTTAHGSTATPEADRIAMYNHEKGLKSDKIPADPNDVVRKTELDTETAARETWDINHAALTTVHGSMATPAANRIAMYDAKKGLKSDKIPSEHNDVVRKIELDAETAMREAQDRDHAALTTAHGSTATPAADRIAMYCAEKGLKSDKIPSDPNDVVRKTELDAGLAAGAQADKEHAALTTAHGSTATPEANRIAMYNADMGLKSDKIPRVANDVARKIEIDALADELMALRLLDNWEGHCLKTLSGRALRAL
jgi:hypothetical protein